MMGAAGAKQKLIQNVGELLEQDFVQADKNCLRGLQELQRDLANDFFTVVVLGEFKRGKSTFINALLGEDLLPTDVLPETATINAIMYNEKPELQIVMQDGTVQQGRAERSFLERYSARNLDSDVNQIKYIKIGYPFRLLENRTVIVDTPGVSDLNEQRCEVTYRFIPKANTVLFLLDANSPLKKTEKDFIDTKLLSQGIDNIIFVVNKYDSVDEEEDADFLENLQLHMLRAFAENEHQLKTLQLYPLSAKMALQGILQNNAALIEASGINEVKEALRRCVQEGRVEELKLQRYKGRMQELLLGLNSSLENKLASAKEQVIPAIQEQMAEYILNLREHIHKYIDEKCAVIVKNSEYAYDDILAAVEQRIDEEIRSKENAGSDLAAEVQRLTTHIDEVQKYLQKLQEVNDERIHTI